MSNNKIVELGHFVIKITWVVICITIALAFLFNMFLPKYEFLDSTHRANKISGKVEYYSTQSWNMGWRE